MTDYADLKQAVAGNLHRTDLTDQIPGFIELAENMISNIVRSTEMATEATLTDAERVAGAGPTYELPEDFLEMRGITVGVSGGDFELIGVSRQELQRMSGPGGTSRPAIYYIYDNKITLRPTPVDGTEVALIYYGRPARLVDDADTNALLENQTDIYLNGALKYAGLYLQDFQYSRDQHDIFLGSAQALNDAEAAKQFSATPSAIGQYNFSSNGYSQGQM